jgi:ketopantoate reductase
MQNLPVITCLRAIEKENVEILFRYQKVHMTASNLHEYVTEVTHTIFLRNMWNASFNVFTTSVLNQTNNKLITNVIPLMCTSFASTFL